MGGKRVCLACRTMLEEGESCEGKKHVTVSLANAAQRARLDDKVWGPDSRARAIRKAAKAGAGGGLAGGIAQNCGGCDVLSGCGDLGSAGEGALALLAVVVAVVVFAGVAILAWAIVKWIVEWYRNRPKPQGALYKPPRPSSRAVRARGRVTSGNRIATPWAEGTATAWAFELFQRRVFGGGAMLREGRTGGFDVMLDDGRVLRVPAGRVHIASRLAKADVEGRRLDAYLAAADPKREERASLFPYDFARATTIEPGTRIEILSDIEPKADDRAGHAYRASSGVLASTTVPVLRILEGEAEGGPRVRVSDDGSEERALAEAEAEGEAESVRDPRPGARAP